MSCSSSVSGLRGSGFLLNIFFIVLSPKLVLILVLKLSISMVKRIELIGTAMDLMMLMKW